jgi:hypothetical protein
MGITDSSWSKSGSSIAITFGKYDHENFCLHKGSLAIWNIAIRDFDEKVPFFTYETMVNLILNISQN